MLYLVNIDQGIKLTGTKIISIGLAIYENTHSLRCKAKSVRKHTLSQAKSVRELSQVKSVRSNSIFASEKRKMWASTKAAGWKWPWTTVTLELNFSCFLFDFLVVEQSVLNLHSKSSCESIKNSIFHLTKLYWSR